MYSDSEPHLSEVRRTCLALPETTEVEAWGRPTFRVAKKMFAIYTFRDAYRLVFKPEPEEREALLADARVLVPPYYGPSGWLAIDLDQVTDWSEVAQLAEMSYLLTAPKRLRDIVLG